MSEREPWAASDALARRVLDRPFAYGDIDKQMATFWFQLRSDHDRVARMCQETAQTLNEVENELERVEAERDDLLARLTAADKEIARLTNVLIGTYEPFGHGFNSGYRKAQADLGALVAESGG